LDPLSCAVQKNKIRTIGYGPPDHSILFRSSGQSAKIGVPQQPEVCSITKVTWHARELAVVSTALAHQGSRNRQDKIGDTSNYSAIYEHQTVGTSLTNLYGVQLRGNWRRVLAKPPKNLNDMKPEVTRRRILLQSAGVAAAAGGYRRIDIE